MNRRGFLSLPFFAAAAHAISKVRRFVARKFVTVGRSGDHATLREAIAEVNAAGGGMVVLLPGHCETISETNQKPIDIGGTGMSIIGSGAGEDRPTIRVDFT